MKTAKLTLLLLIIATAASFVVAQRLKQSDPVIRGLRSRVFFSPNGDGVRDLARLAVQIKERDRVTVQIIDHNGKTVKTVVSDRSVPSNDRLKFNWHGDTNSGGKASDGTYRVRVVLPRQGRSATLSGSVILDTKPPRIVITEIEPQESNTTGPAILPSEAKSGATIHFKGPNYDPMQVLIYKTSGGTVEAVDAFTVEAKQKEILWSGQVDGKPASQDTYFVLLKTRDRAGNLGDSGMPTKSGKVRGHPGITVSYVSAEPVLTPLRDTVKVKLPVTSRLDSGAYRWELRMAGSGKSLKRGNGKGSSLTLHLPKVKKATLYLLEIKAGKRPRYTLALPNSKHPVRAEVKTPLYLPVEKSAKAKILLVLPVLSMQAVSDIDENGLGLPTTLLNADAVSLRRPLTVSQSSQDQLKALIGFLDRNRLRYQLTTDLALAKKPGLLKKYRGVVLLPTAEWFPTNLAESLKSYVNKGGGVWVAGTGVANHSLKVTKDKLETVSQSGKSDIFGADFTKDSSDSGDFLVSSDTDAMLFTGTDGAFSGLGSDNFISRVPEGAKLLAAAGSSADKPVIAAIGLGKGTVFYSGSYAWLSELAKRDPETETVTRNIWNLLSR